LSFNQESQQPSCLQELINGSSSSSKPFCQLLPLTASLLPPQHESAYHEDEDPTNKAAIIQRSKSMRSGAQKNKLIIIMVGLPGRGKTFLCNKLKCYLNW
jgi:hypothetical protein